ncbi:PaaI family thioesterase [Streptomyces scopuliridis]|uniref:PaaI family thioesterase n=1 Tax=Streptomyces scopuliridis TaxID=452529 RepID=UPI0036BB3237
MNLLSTPSTAPEQQSQDPLDRRRAAISVLGHELRVLVDTAVRTTVAPDVLHRLAEGVRGLTGQLTGRRRTRGEIPVVDEFPGGVRMFNPVSGAGSPLAPPVRVTRTEDGVTGTEDGVTGTEDGVTGTCVLGIAHEGPPGYGHGGMSAMLLDELMGLACVAAGMPAMTVSLQMRYHRPVPVQTPLRVDARITGTEDRKISVTGSITTEADHSTVLVSADALFVSPDPDRARDLFPGPAGCLTARRGERVCRGASGHTLSRFPVPGESAGGRPCGSGRTR